MFQGGKMTILDKLNEEIKNAMKSQNAKRLDVVRMLKAKILQVNARGQVTEEEAIKLFKNFAAGLQEMIDICRKNNKPEAAQAAEADLAIAKEFLPKEMSRAEVEEVAKEILKANALVGPAALGPAMSKIMTALKGKADGSMVKEVVAQLLKGDQ
jgi:uncharacterized protein